MCRHGHSASYGDCGCCGYYFNYGYVLLCPCPFPALSAGCYLYDPCYMLFVVVDGVFYCPTTLGCRS